MSTPAFKLHIVRAPVAFTVQSFTGFEAISQPFVFEVDVTCRDNALDMRGLMYQSAYLAFSNGKGGFHGQVHGVERRHFLPGPACYRLTLGPQLACLGQRYNQRIFQDCTALQIIRRVLQEHGIRRNNYRFDLKTECQPRRYCAQYRETDLQFLQRLCAQEGIHYHFRHSRQGHELVFGDGLRSFRRVPEAPFQSVPNVEGVRRFAVSHEQAETPGSRMQQLAEGESTLPFLGAGQLLPLTGHPQQEWNHLWLVTEVRHQGAGGYLNQWQATPWEVGFRAPESPNPERLPGMQQARVVEACADADGRVRVQFDWGGHGQGAALSQCWLPVAAHLQERAHWYEGMPVVVSFLEGDADRPLISGCMPVGPLSLPAAQLPAPMDERHTLAAWLDPQILLAEERGLQINDGLKVSFEEGCQLLLRVGSSTVELDGRSLMLTAPRLDLSPEPK
ncbi:contractile injection system protein, VgrG/Pvc8 family [Pseudomonas sp. Pseusp122]|uniref:contractile injection system protein, VgrG/Pvc8 family n=1 Tax=unclassified Pseudomonas TaxID=196821 RepID=UPI0039A4EC41